MKCKRWAWSLLMWMMIFMAGGQQVKAESTVTTLWNGNQSFTDWSKVVDISSSKLSQSVTDDVIRLVMTTSDNAQLQVSYGSNWTNLPGLGNMGISGNYELLVTSNNLRQLKQGIHIKGVNYTLTKVELIHNSETFSSERSDLFDWGMLNVSGGSKGTRNALQLDVRGGAGWYWEDTVDLSSARKLTIRFEEPLQAPLILQMMYDTNSVKTATIATGKREYILRISGMSHVFSVNVMSATAQRLSLIGIELIDRDGNVITTGIENTSNTTSEELTSEIYDTAGHRLMQTRPGINLLRQTMADGTVSTRKIYVRH